MSRDVPWRPMARGAFYPKGLTRDARLRGYVYIYIHPQTVLTVQWAGFRGIVFVGLIDFEKYLGYVRAARIAVHAAQSTPSVKDRCQ